MRNFKVILNIEIVGADELEDYECEAYIVNEINEAAEESFMRVDIMAIEEI